ncbi:MAG: hypothetical protein ACTS73_08910 [Arsenophonus sp. NEOnobi-MAG3]
MRNLSNTRYGYFLYFLVDGIYSPVRKEDLLCLLVIIGVSGMDVRNSLRSKIFIKSQNLTTLNL